jgi:hypothetical protein
MTDYTFKLYSLDQIPGVPASSTSAGQAFNMGGTTTFDDVGTPVTITDDDEFLEDVGGQPSPETGANAVLTNTVTVDGATYSAGTQVNAVAQVEVTNITTGETGFAQIITFGGNGFRACSECRQCGLRVQHGECQPDVGFRPFLQFCKIRYLRIPKPPLKCLNRHQRRSRDFGLPPLAWIRQRSLLRLLSGFYSAIFNGLLRRVGGVSAK